MGAELFHVDGLADIHDKCKSRFYQFSKAPRNWSVSIDFSINQEL
jgi:hypothetical protein